MKTIIFDEHCTGWTKYPELNKMFIIQQIDYLNMRYHAYGYMYRNSIHEAFGIPWDPREENTCWYDADYLPISYEWSEEHQTYLIKIG